MTLMEFTIQRKRFVKSEARHKIHLRTFTKVPIRGEGGYYRGWYLLCKGVPTNAEVIGFDHSWNTVSKYAEVNCRKCLESLGRMLANEG